MTEKPKIYLSNEVFQKIMHWVNKSEYEVSGLGTVVQVTPGVFRVTDAILLPQKNGMTHTDIEAEDVGKAMFNLRTAPGELRWWWHSHVDMGVFWSGTDRTTISDCGAGGWFLATVFNKKRETKSAFYSVGGFKLPWAEEESIFLDDLPLYVDAYVNPKAALWDAEYEENVTNVVPKQWAYSGHPVYERNPETGRYERVEEPALTTQRPPGMTRKEWKRYRKQMRRQAKAGGALVSADEIDAYGFTQEERTLLAQEGWDEGDLDLMIGRGYTPLEIMELASNGLSFDEMDFMTQQAYTVADILAAAEIHDQKMDEADDEELDDDDDMPVMDRAAGGKYDS